MVQTGSKSLLFPDVPKIENLEQVEQYLRRIMDILEELNRRRYEGLLSVYASGGRAYLAKVTGQVGVPAGNGWYTCTIYKFKDKELAADTIWEEYGTGTARNLVDWVHTDNLLADDWYMICWPLTEPKTHGGYWVGVELFGRGTFQGCEI